jgi:hypothetical protein
MRSLTAFLALFFTAAALSVDVRAQAQAKPAAIPDLSGNYNGRR